MTIVYNLLIIVQILAALAMIGLVLMQHGKGADAGAAFGGGSGSASLFGATGGANFLSRTTAVMATVFFASTLVLAYLGHARPTPANSGSVLDNVQVQTAPVAPAQPAAAPGQIPGQ